MKNLIKGLALLAVLSQIYACRKDSPLDAQSTDELNVQKVFADSSRTSDHLFGIYGFITRESSIEKWYDIRMGWTDATDESNHRLGGPTQPNGVIISGALAPGNSTGNHPYRTTYIESYLAIRQANIFLANVDKSPFSANMKKLTKAQARFLRVWYYHNLIRAWGGVVLMGDDLLTPNDNFDRPRSSYEECVNYLVSELDAIQNDLPPSWDSENYGRITSVAVAALKSRILLYAASPLTNGGNIGQNEAQRSVTGYDSYSEQRWVNAANAAKAAMDLADANGYGLLVNHQLGNGASSPGYGFVQMFTLRRNKESLLQGMHPRGGDSRLGGSVLPPGVEGISGNNPNSVPTHNLVMAFGTINGKPTSEDTEWKATDPYKKRDPRLHFSVITHGTFWRLSSATTQSRIFTHVGSAAGFTGSPTNSYWYTGYYNRKMLDSTHTTNSARSPSQRVWHLIRYAELVMNYAEALNESGNSNAAVQQLKRIRERAGIRPGADGNYGLDPNAKKEDLRKVILNERQVEFAFEGHRYFDVRRTKTAMENQNVKIKAIKITRIVPPGNPAPSITDQYIYEPADSPGPAPDHVFREANYWFPFHQDEVNKNPLLIQNPGY